MNDMSLKARIRKMAEDKNVSAQAVLQIYLMHRFLFRLSQSSYKDKFVVKGGTLISSIIGIDHRTTMDLDTTVRNLPVTAQSIELAFNDICSISSDDGIDFVFEKTEPIRDDDEYGGYRVYFYAKFGKINAPMSMDVSTGDIMTPGASRYVFNDILDETVSFELWSYNVETVLAEKLETILSRGSANTRPRDYYDVYMLSALDYDKQVLKEAFNATANHRGSKDKIVRYDAILDDVLSNREMAERWEVYSETNPYASGISFKEVVDAVRLLSEICGIMI